MSEFLKWCSMGGYGGYVWPAYGLALVVFAFNLANVRFLKKKAQLALKQWYQKQSHE